MIEKQYIKLITKRITSLTVLFTILFLSVGLVHAQIFDEIRIPVVTVNGDMWPINYEAHRRHMFSYDAIVLKDADHFLMMNRAEEFNRALEKAINVILQKRAK